MIVLLLSLGLLGQSPASGVERPKESAARLEFMKKAVAAHALQAVDRPK
jgi:hypothetical protein